MLSFKPIKANASRHIASIEDKDGNFKELIYFTELSRVDKVTDNNFEEELKQYTTPSSTIKDFHMNNDHQLTIMPSNDTKGLQRETVSVFGKSGSGKSYQINNYIMNYHTLKPRNKIFYFSVNDIKRDESIDDATREFITQVDLLAIDAVMDVKDFENSLVVFDDVLDVTVPIRPDLLFGERYTLGNVTERSKMERECSKRAESIKSSLHLSVKNILNLGRKYNISCIAVYHKLRSGSESTFLVEESSSCWLYPYTATKKPLMGFLEERLSLSKEDAKEIAQEKFYQWEFLYLNNSGKLFYFTPNHFKFLD